MQRGLCPLEVQRCHCGLSSPKRKWLLQSTSRVVVERSWGVQGVGLLQQQRVLSVELCSSCCLGESRIFFCGGILGVHSLAHRMGTWVLDTGGGQIEKFGTAHCHCSRMTVLHGDAPSTQPRPGWRVPRLDRWLHGVTKSLHAGGAMGSADEVNITISELNRTMRVRIACLQCNDLFPLLLTNTSCTPGVFTREEM